MQLPIQGPEREKQGSVASDSCTGKWCGRWQNQAMKAAPGMPLLIAFCDENVAVVVHGSRPVVEHRVAHAPVVEGRLRRRWLGLELVWNLSLGFFLGLRFFFLLSSFSLGSELLMWFMTPWWPSQAIFSDFVAKNQATVNCLVQDPRLLLPYRARKIGVLSAALSNLLEKRVENGQLRRGGYYSRRGDWTRHFTVPRR